MQKVLEPNGHNSRDSFMRLFLFLPLFSLVLFSFAIFSFISAFILSFPSPSFFITRPKGIALVKEKIGERNKECA